MEHVGSGQEIPNRIFGIIRKSLMWTYSTIIQLYIYINLKKHEKN